MKIEILIADQLDESARDILERHSRSLTFTVMPWKELVGELDRAHVLICRAAHRVTKELLDRASHLKLIVVAGVGLENIDLAAAEKLGIEVLNAQEANATSTAELTWGLILGLSRNLNLADSLIRRKKWRKDDRLRKELRGIELKGKTLGLIGLGRVGSRVAARAKAFEMNVLACDPYISKDAAHGIPLVSHADIFSKSDIVSLHIPLTKETRKLVNARALKGFRDNAFLVNTSRGAVVDEGSIIKALRAKKLAGYAADVFEKEPPEKRSPLLRAPRTFLSPHLGAQTHEAQRAVSVMAVQRVIEFIQKKVA